MALSIFDDKFMGAGEPAQPKIAPKQDDRQGVVIVQQGNQDATITELEAVINQLVNGVVAIRKPVNVTAIIERDESGKMTGFTIKENS